MRKIIVLSIVKLDGIMQAPRGPEEDTSGGFPFGGWVAPYSKKVSDMFMERLLKTADPLLGRKTFNILEEYWPKHAAKWLGINEVTKYVLSTTKEKSDWQNSIFLKNLAEIEKLKTSNGSDIKVWGSSKLVQLLFQDNLVDEFWLIIHPILLEEGKKLFDNSSTPASYILHESLVTPKGVIIANYKQAGKVKTGPVGS